MVVIPSPIYNHFDFPLHFEWKPKFQIQTPFHSLQSGPLPAVLTSFCAPCIYSLYPQLISFQFHEHGKLFSSLGPLYIPCRCPLTHPSVARLSILKYLSIPEASHFNRNNLENSRFWLLPLLTSSLTSLAPANVVIFSSLEHAKHIPICGPLLFTCSFCLECFLSDLCVAAFSHSISVHC